MEKVTASVITIGDELLIGQVIDTNSSWIAKELNKVGIWVTRRVAVGDVWADIWQALDEESRRADLVLITGGLGPTSDDITKPLLCEYFGGRMVTDAPTLEHLKDLFENVLKRPMIGRNAQQAQVPDVCTVLKNDRGTAPGMLFEKNGKTFISMPGVPSEMQSIMLNEAIPRIVKKYRTGHIIHRTLLTAGIGESYLADMLSAFEAGLPGYIKLAYLPNYGLVRLRLTMTGADEAAMTTEIDARFGHLKELVKEYLVTDSDIPMEAVVGELLLARKQTVATAESCTGGYIAHLLTSIPGSSAYYMGSVVSYDYRIKKEVLGVRDETLLTYGAVSEETVREMVAGILGMMRTDFAVAVSGIMGPGGGMPGKPVGQVWMAIASRERVVTKKFNFRFDRGRNIQLTAVNALDQLRRFILETGRP